MGFYVRGRGPVGFSFSGPASVLALPFLLLALFIQGLVFAVAGFARLSVPIWRWLGRAIVSCAVWLWRFYVYLFRQAWKLLVVAYRRLTPLIRRRLQESAARRTSESRDARAKEQV